jgi:hypothetical protein
LGDDDARPHRHRLAGANARAQDFTGLISESLQPQSVPWGGFGRPPRFVTRLESGRPRATWIVATARGRRLLHDNESGALQMSYDPIGDNRSHAA